MEEIKIRIIKQKPKLRRTFLRAEFLLHKNSFFTILAAVTFAGIFCTGIYVFATYPGTPYAPGETLNPSCAPNSDANCTVTTPAAYSFGSNNFSGTGSITTTNTIQAGTLKVGSAYTFPTADGNNGQVLSTNGAGVVSWSDAGASGAPTTAHYFTNQAETGLSAEVNLGALTTGILKISVSGGVATASTITDGSSNWDAASSHKTTEDAINGLVSVNGAGTYSAKSIGTDVQAQLNGTGFVKASGTNISYDNSTYMANPMDAAGQLIYGGTAGAASKLAAGLSGQILQSNGAASPAWSTATYPATTTQNQILYSTGNNTVGAGSGLTYDGTNLTVGASTEVFTVLTNGNVGIGDSNPSFPLEIVSTSIPQLMLYHTNSSVSTSLGVGADGNLTITPSGGNAIIAGTLTVGATNTAGTLATRVITSGPPAEADANGSLVIDSGDGGRLYFRYNNAWNYIAQNSGFQIPNFETADPISGEEIKEGDIVLGMINKTLDDKALHGVYVKWESVKAQLLAEARGELISSGALGSGSLTGVSTETFLDKVANVLVTLGITIKDGITNINKLAVQNLTADVARIKKIEMVDSSTGEVYCTWVENGDWVKSKGNCGDISTVAEVPVQMPVSNIQQQTPQESASSVEQITQQAVQAAQQAVEQAADQAAREAAQQVQEQLQTQQQTPVPAEQTPASAEQVPAEQTPALEEQSQPLPEAQVKEAVPSEQTAPAENNAVEIAPSALSQAVGGAIRQAVINVFSFVWGFIKGITGFAGKKIILSSAFQNSTASLSSAQAGFSNAASGFINYEGEFINWLFANASKTFKNSTAGLTSFVAHNVMSDFRQIVLQIHTAKEIITSRVDSLLKK